MIFELDQSHPYNTGALAAESGAPVGSNPYDLLTPDGQEWRRGWADFVTIRAGRALGGKSAPSCHYPKIPADVAADVAELAGKVGPIPVTSKPRGAK